MSEAQQLEACALLHNPDLGDVQQPDVEAAAAAAAAAEWSIDSWWQVRAPRLPTCACRWTVIAPAPAPHNAIC